MPETARSNVEMRDRNNFDFLRFALASAVLYSHSCMLFGNRTEIIRWMTHDQTDAGDLAVNGFFAISGYLITISWERSAGTFDYLRKRVLRILPPYLAMAVVCAFLIGPLGADHLLSFWRLQRWPRLVAEALTFHNLTLAGLSFPGSSAPDVMNGSTWTIRIEFECYLLVM